MLRATRFLFGTVVLCATAQAAAVIYDFSGTVNFIGAVELFRYTAPAFITADTFIPASALDLCSTGQMLPCFGVNFLPSGPDTPQHYLELTFQILNPDIIIAWGPFFTTFHWAVALLPTARSRTSLPWETREL